MTRIGVGQRMSALAVTAALTASTACAQDNAPVPGPMDATHAGGNVVVEPLTVRPGTLAAFTGGTVTLEELDAYLRNKARVDPATFDFSTEKAQRFVQDVVRRIAFERILLQQATLRQIDADPRVKRSMKAAEHDVLLKAAWDALIAEPAQVSDEEMLEYLEERAAEQTLPETATFRFMMFEAPKSGGAEARAEALKRAREAQEALEAGEEFTDVAARLATPPVDGVPGKLYGPVAFEGRMSKPISEALRTTPPGEASDIIDTTAGFVIVAVVDYQPEHHPAPDSLRATLGREYALRAMENRRVAVLNELKETHPWEFHRPTADSPDDMVVARVADRPGFMQDDIQAFVRMGSPAEVESYYIENETTGLPRIIEEELLIARFAEEHDIAAPEIQEAIAEAQRRERIIWMTTLLRPQTSEPVPTEEQLQAYYEKNAAEFRRPLVDAQMLEVSFATLATHTGSTDKLAFYRWAEEAARKAGEGASFESLTSEMEAWGQSGDQVTEFTAEVPARLPYWVRDSAMSIEPGSVTKPIMKTETLVLLKVLKREEGLPPLDAIRWEVQRAWVATQEKPRPLQEELLETMNFTQLADPGQLAWDENGTLILKSGEDAED
ncbi:MAG: PPIC-type domain [Candidatus Sumerlaeota bacterium]|nr:PPIC-type domain [Candidatus Sumerlaeota bacterium]